MKKLILLSILLIVSCEETLEPEDCTGVPGGSAVCGCNNENAVNYDSTATNDDGSCIFDTTEPSIQFTSPNPNDTLGGIITLRVEAQDDYEITKVEFKLHHLYEIDGETILEDDSLFTDMEEPYEYEWNSTEYEYVGASFSARAYDGQNDKDIHLYPIYIDNRPEPVNVTSVQYVWNEGHEYIIQWEESTIEDFVEYKLLWYNVEDSTDAEGNMHNYTSIDTIVTISDRSVTSYNVNIISGMPPTQANTFVILVKNELGFTIKGDEMENETLDDPTIVLHPAVVEGDSITLTWSRSTAFGDEYYQLFESTSANITSGYTRNWYVGVSGSDTTITVPILEDQYGGRETMFYQVHVFATFGQEAVSNIMPLYLDPCGDGEVNIWGWCRNIEETTSIHHNEPGWSWLTPHPRGPIPAAIGELVNLTELIVEHSPLDGPIPPEIGNLTNLTHLEFWNTNLTGPLPSEIGNLVNLETLMLSGNNFTGQIPEGIGNFTLLRKIDIGYSDLSGNIPTGIENCVDLINLSLQHNLLSGPIPAGIGNLVNLETLMIHDNKLTGPIPAGIGNLINLRAEHGHVPDLDLSNNELTGPIPSEIGLMQNITKLDFSNNNLGGTIPSEIGSMNNLIRLRLENNQLTDQIPIEIGNLDSLEELTLHNNQLNGPIPNEVGNLVHLVEFTLHDNNLSGEIPAQIVNLINITSLDFSNNELTGPVPTELGDMYNLESLHLENNFLTFIPEDICNLNFDFWHRFDAGNNNICPPYPSCMGNLGAQDTTNCD